MITPEFWLWNHKFRVSGVLLGVAFHMLMLLSLINGSEADGYRALFWWYLPSLVLGLPWSLLALFIPGGAVFGLMAAVCFNGYLVGWPIDAVVNHQRRQRQGRIIDSYLQAAAGSHASHPGC